MDPQSMSKSIAMLKAVLAGETFEAIASRTGLTRSAVQQRVKALALDLQVVVGVVGVAEDARPTATVLRERRDSYLEALEHYQPEHAVSRRSKNGVISEQQLDLLVERTERISDCRKRDVALLLVLFSTAAKPLEIARLEVRDYLNPDGSVREESVLRAETAIRGEPRPLFFQSARANAAINVYLDERRERGHGASTSTGYRGLLPESWLFLTDEGDALPIRLSCTGHQRRQRCGIILDIYRKIFGRAGLKGVSEMSARRTVAHKLKERGIDDRDIGTILGLKERTSMRNLLPRQRQSIKSMMRELV